MTDQLPERRSALPDRWEPFRELEQVTGRMRRMLDEMFGGFVSPMLATDREAWSPPVDIAETDDAYVIEAELPGVKREDVTAELVGNELRITGEIKEHERDGTLRRSTRRTGRFAYRAAIPSRVDPDTIEASLADGVLTVRVPKSEEDQARRINITA